MSIAITGFDGGNPLGFLATVGLLRLLSPQARLHWEFQGCWRPQIDHPELNDLDGVVELVWERLQSWQMPEPFALEDNTNKFSREAYRQACQTALDSPPNQELDLQLEWLAAIACDACSEGDFLADTSLRTMSGAGAQHFLKTIRDLKVKSEKQHIQEALKGPWRYKDDRLTMRFDPKDDRRSALRWNLAGEEPTRSVWGANLLAGIAVGCFPSFPGSAGLRTLGFKYDRRAAFLCWPLWASPLTLQGLQSLLGLALLHQGPISDKARKALSPPQLRKKEQQLRERRRQLQALGVLEILQSRRLTIDKIRNFTPAEPA